MRDFDEHTITEAVVKSFQSTPDPRLQQLLSSLTRHLHAYVKEVEPTIEEWDYAIDYLTRTGQICDDKRQEYILLSHRSEERRVGKGWVSTGRSWGEPSH